MDGFGKPNQRVCCHRHQIIAVMTEVCRKRGLDTKGLHHRPGIEALLGSKHGLAFRGGPSLAGLGHFLALVKFGVSPQACTI
jgi:hypothetical protein